MQSLNQGVPEARNITARPDDHTVILTRLFASLSVIGNAEVFALQLDLFFVGVLPLSVISIVTVVVVLDAFIASIIFDVEAAMRIILRVKPSIVGDLPLQLIVGRSTIVKAGIGTSLDAQVF